MTNLIKGLLLIAHGSKNKDSIKEIYCLVEKLEGQSNHFDLIECAFLELAEPDITQGLDSLINKGATEISVLPYFLAKGNHVVNDVPREVSKIQASHSDIKINILPHIGQSQNIHGLILEHIALTE